MKQSILRNPEYSVTAGSDPDTLTMRFAARICPQALVWDQDDATRDKMLLNNAIALNDWAAHQARQCREVMEHVIDTGEKRMRPLRPEDV